MLIQVEAFEKICETFYFPNNLTVKISENFGLIKVYEKNSENQYIPLRKAYVKCFQRSKKNKNSINFYKDGYTDIRGCFDYASLNEEILDQIDKFALMVISERGFVVRTCSVPSKVGRFQETRVLDKSV